MLPAVVLVLDLVGNVFVTIVGVEILGLDAVPGLVLLFAEVDFCEGVGTEGVALPGARDGDGLLIFPVPDVRVP